MAALGVQAIGELAQHPVTRVPGAVVGPEQTGPGAVALALDSGTRALGEAIDGRLAVFRVGDGAEHPDPGAGAVIRTENPDVGTVTADPGAVGAPRGGGVRVGQRGPFRRPGGEKPRPGRLRGVGLPRGRRPSGRRPTAVRRRSTLRSGCLLRRPRRAARHRRPDPSSPLVTGSPGRPPCGRRAVGGARNAHIVTLRHT